MGEQRDKPDPIITMAGEAVGYLGADQGAAKVSASLGEAGVKRKNTLFFIPIFLAFYADT